MDPLMLAVLIVVVFFANLYASSVGGAALLVLPVMFLVGVPANIAVATNRLYRVFASGISGAKYLRNVKVRMKNIALYSFLSAAGAVAGAFVVINLNKGILKLGILIVLLPLALFFLLKKDLGLKKQKEKPLKQNLAFSSATMFGIAIYRSIIGSASGTFLRMYFILKEKLSFLQAATYSSVIAVVANIFGAMIFIWAGIIDYWIAFYITISGMCGSYLGAHFAIAKGNEFIRKLFLMVVIVTIARLLGGILFGI